MRVTIAQNKTIIILLIIAGFLVYGNTLTNQMFWDDNDFVLNNQYVKDWQYFSKYFSENLIAGAGLISNYWRPVLLFVFSLEYHIWGDWAPGFHFINMAFHVADGILLFFILLRIFDLSRPSATLPRPGEGLGERSKWPAFLTSLIFIIHPLQTEAVSYVSSLGDSLSVFFMFGGILLYLKERKILAVLAYTLALMSKETAVIMPALIFLIEYVRNLTPSPSPGPSPLNKGEGERGVRPRRTGEVEPWPPSSGLRPPSPSRGEGKDEVAISERAGVRYQASLWRTIKLAWPLFAIAAIYIGLRATNLNFLNTFNLYNEQNIFTDSPWVRLLTFFRILTVYFILLFWPWTLHMERSVEIATSFASWDVILGAFLAFGLLVLGFYSLKRWPVISFGIFWFFIALSPTSNIVVPINGLLYEHWMYVPMIGIFLVVVWLVQATSPSIPPHLLGREIKKDPSLQVMERGWERGRGIKKFISIFLIIYLIFFTARAVTRNQEWRDPIIFYNQTLERAPASYRVINNLGMEYAEREKFEEAVTSYKRAILLNPEVPVAYHNLGNAYKATGQIELAIQQFEKAIELEPKFIYSYNALINLYLEKNEQAKAREILQRYQEASSF